jgi:hypothetical protein
VNSEPRKRPREVPLLWLSPQACAARETNSVAPKPWISQPGKPFQFHAAEQQQRQRHILDRVGVRAHAPLHGRIAAVARARSCA